MTENATDDRMRKERSPSFPFIQLEKAINRAQAMFVAHRKNQTRSSSGWRYVGVFAIQ